MNTNNKRNFLEIKNISKSYGDVKVLDQVSLEIEPGSTLCLLGKNGAGKSTLINIIAGILPSDQGTVEINGFNLQDDPVAYCSSLGFMPQEINFNQFTSLRDVLYTNALLFGVPEAEQRVYECLDLVGLLPEANDLVKTLSGGMKRRLMVARAILHRPSLLIMDEPTTGVDISRRSDIWLMLKNIQSEYKSSILLSTHHSNETRELAHKVTVLDKGKITLKPTLIDQAVEKANYKITFTEPVDLHNVKNAELEFLSLSSAGNVWSVYADSKQPIQQVMSNIFNLTNTNIHRIEEQDLLESLLNTNHKV